MGKRELATKLTKKNHTIIMLFQTCIKANREIRFRYKITVLVYDNQENCLLYDCTCLCLWPTKFFRDHLDGKSYDLYSKIYTNL